MSLADQLKARTTLDSTRLTNQSSLKHPPSFIFTARHAATLTIEDLHSLASNAWDQLSSIDIFFEKFQNKILGPEAKRTDRGNLTKEENDKLDRVLEKVLRALGRHIMTKPAGVVLEWLVRRFRVNDLNLPSVIALFLPYHTTSHFPSALALLPASTLLTTPFSAFIPAQQSLAPVPLPALIALLPPFSKVASARALLDFILRMPIEYLEKDEKVHRALISFWLQLLAGYLERAGSALPVGEQVAVLSSLLEVLKLSRTQEDLLIAVYILLTRYSVHYPLDGEKLRVVLKALVVNQVSLTVMGLEKRAGESEGRENVDRAMMSSLVVVSMLAEEEAEVKDGKKYLGNSGWKSLMRIDGLAAIVVSMCTQYQAEKFMNPFVTTLVSESLINPSALAVLSDLFNPIDSEDSDDPAFLPANILSLITRHLLLTLLKTTTSETPSNEGLIKLLSNVYQRYPEVWTAESTNLLSTLDAEGVKTLRSIINNVLGGGVFSGAVLESESPDLNLRILALKDILAGEEKGMNVDEDEMMVLGDEDGDSSTFVHDVLLARLSEPVEKILEMLLSPEGEGIKKVQSLLSPEEILNTLVATLKTVSNSTSKSAISIESIILNYLSNPYIIAFPSKKEDVLKRAWWSRILKSKTSAAKDLPSLAGTTLGKEYEWVKGMTGESNEEIVGKIGKNLAGLEESKRILAINFLLSEIVVKSGEGDNQPGSGRRLLSLLVSARFIARLDITSKINFATQILNTLDLESYGLDYISSNKPESILADSNGTLSPLLVQAIYTKSTAYNTLRRTRAALVLTAVASLRPTEGSSWSWLAKQGKETSYYELLHAVYRIAHTASTAGTLNLASKLLQSLFTTAISGGDIVAFLASVWISTDSSDLKVVALNDTATYVLAKQKVNKSIDFQLLLPATLLALEDVEKKVRIAGLELLRAVQSAMPSSMTDIYGKGLFYGPATSGAIKYLDVVDTARYISKLLESHVEFSMDGKYIVIFHQAILGSNEPEVKKKSASLKSKVFHYLLSHVAAWPNVYARAGLLRAVSGIVDPVKSALIVPILNEVVKSTVVEREELSAGLSIEMIKQYAGLLLGPYEGVSKKFLESTEHTALDTFLRSLEITDDTGIGATLRKDALVIVKTSLFATVRGETRLDLFKRLARLSSTSDSRLNADASECLRVCKVDHDTIATFLNEIRLAIATPVAKGAKRGRTSLGHATSSRAERIPELVVVLESIEFKTVRASHALVLTLFDLLSTLIEISASTQMDIQYSGQLLLSTLSKVIENVTPASGVTADSIRMAPVLDLMRSTVNPQTSHQALLLLAQLGPLVPDQLAHNIMPIFTFMGANVLQRDDAYSLRVVDRTLESIVPALVNSMKASSSDRISLVSELKKLLRVFTDAATHVPRHRRIKLFVRFVQTLGASDFLSCVSMLLVDKAQGTDPNSLPLSVFESFPVDVQLSAFKQIIQEISALLSNGIEGSVAPFLDIPTESTPVVNSEDAKEQVLNLINFLALSLETKQLYAKIDAARAAGNQEVDKDLSELVRNLLDISNIKVIDYTPSEKAELSVATGYALQATVHLMSTQSFSEAVLWLLNLSDSTLQSSAQALLRNRLPTIKPARRGDISPAVVSVVERVRISLSDPATNLEQALVTLEVVADSVWAEEDAVLAKSVPELLVVAGTASTSPKATKLLAMSIIKKLANRLGPRLIPLASKITPFAVDILRSEARDPLSISHNMVSAAFEVLEGLFTSIPTFIGTQLDKVLEACLSSDILSLTNIVDSPSAKARALLLSTAAKKVPAKALYPSIIRLHGSIDLSTKEPLIGLLDILNRALRQGKTTDIAENYRPVFKLFLSVFDLRRIHNATLDSEDINHIEENALGAFVQFILKLNEQTFRPLFLRTYDWAVIDLAEETNPEVALTARRIVLYKLVDRLLAQLKSIVVPYFSFMLDQTVELLDNYSKGNTTDITLWTSLTSALTKSLIFDESGFWTPLRLAKISTPIASQIESASTSTTALTQAFYHPLLAAYALSLAPHENLLKEFNSTLLMLTRSDDLKVKRGALEAIEQLWENLGDSMVGLVPESTTFLAETLEEIDGGVEMVTRRLVTRIEEHLGESLQSFLEN